jgi:hypothetical protein
MGQISCSYLPRLLPADRPIGEAVECIAAQRADAGQRDHTAIDHPYMARGVCNRPAPMSDFPKKKIGFFWKTFCDFPCAGRTKATPDDALAYFGSAFGPRAALSPGRGDAFEAEALRLDS